MKQFRAIGNGMARRPIVMLGAMAITTAASAGGPCHTWITEIGEPGFSPAPGDSTGYVFDLILFDDGSGPSLYAGGEFSRAGHINQVHNIAKWDGGSDWSRLGHGLECDFCGLHDPMVTAMEVFDDGTGPALYVVGRFNEADGEPAENIAKWDGTSWTEVGGGLTDPVIDWVTAWSDMLVWDDGTGPALYVASNYATYGGQAVGGISKWDGKTWTDLDDGVDGSIFTIGIYDDGDGEALYAGGVFTMAGDVSAYNIAKWDGQQWSALPDVPDGWLDATSDRPYDMVAWDDGAGDKLYIAGHYFSTAMQARGILVWDGKQWEAMSGAGTTAYSVTVWDDGTGETLFVGGFGPRKWDGSAWTLLQGTETSTGVRSLLALPPGGLFSVATLVVAGSFEELLGEDVQRIALYQPCPDIACLGDNVNSKTFQPPGDGTIDGADLAYLLGEWGANPGSLADIVDSATFQPPPDGVVDGADLAVLLGAWGACS